jgi:6-pyruvoyltetrahydropterin/6-carboxytetrahydropterin synthase
MMPKYSITRRLEWDAGHRVYGHESRCAYIHGHRYVALVTVEPNEGLDSIGRVVDFSVVKLGVGGWIDKAWDHGVILCEDDPLCKIWATGFGINEFHKFYIMKANPTAENIARELYEVGNELLTEHDVRITKVVVNETPNCSAEWS